MPFLFGLTLFVSAFLLFLIQPMFARMALPLLGGSPGVWNTALVFYQGALLLGYAYAHVSLRGLGVARQRWVQLLVLGGAVLALPIGVARGWEPPTSANPVLWLLALLTVSIGLPFVTVSSGAPVLQRWFAATGHRQSADPYFLYAASNAGSLTALVAYPLLVEPYLRLQQQALAWSAGYGLLVVLTGVCAWAVGRPPQAQGADAEGPTEDAPPPPDEEPAPGTRRRLHWLLLAAVPASLMAGVNTYISNEIAAVPLLWILPLALYLLTFILAFSRRQALSEKWAAWLFAPLMAGLVFVMAIRASRPLPALIAVHLGVFFLAAYLCHRRLANDRPRPDRLTEFYLWLSAGGVLGGAFNALLAPVVFRSIAEYPVALVVACLVARPSPPGLPWFRFRWDAFPALLVGGLAANLVVLVPRWVAGVSSASGYLMAVPVLLIFGLSKRPARFGLTVGAVFLAAMLSQDPIIRADRSFFGVYKVSHDPGKARHYLSHGNTLHGEQRWQPRSTRPLTYYHPTGPIGKVLALEQRFRRVAVVGLGAGTLAAYGRPHQRWTFYEIDPAVLRIAQNPQLFTYLAECRAPYQVVLGDARLSLRAAPPAAYDLIVLDAYTSDAVPIHLLTREALRLYLAKLAPRGLLAFHISNRHFDLEPVLAAMARELNLQTTGRSDDALTPADEADGKAQSQWVFVARGRSELRPWSAEPGWSPAVGRPAFPVWTDDFANTLAAFRWR